jgi:crotonobetaine/carnitine-CoA ligase
MVGMFGFDSMGDETANADRILRAALVGNGTGEALATRLGVRGYVIYNMTELNTPLQARPGVPTPAGSCGCPRPGVEVRAVDENDLEVPVGERGELIVRSDVPWDMNLGYLNQPEASVRAWRNGWFHTGDVFVRDADGFYYFVDRTKDTVRRRGENISSFEVEAEVVAHPDVAECAVVAVPDAREGEEVRAIVALRQGATLGAEELIAFVGPRLPAFMVPRYVDFVDELPRNPTGKVLKHELRGAGIGASTWDRLAPRPDDRRR